jgi:hypothetical protein
MNYNARSGLVRFENKNIFFYILFKKSAPSSVVNAVVVGLAPGQEAILQQM